MYIMETITFKIQADIVKKIDSLLHSLYFNNRTEFIREALREKLRKVENELFVQKLEKLKGISKKKQISDKELKKIREQITEEYAKKLN